MRRLLCRIGWHNWEKQTLDFGILIQTATWCANCDKRNWYAEGDYFHTPKETP